MLGQPNRNLSADRHCALFSHIFLPFFFVIFDCVFTFPQLKRRAVRLLIFHELKAFSVFHLSMFCLFNIRWQQYVNPLGHQCIVPRRFLNTREITQQQPTTIKLHCDGHNRLKSLSFVDSRRTDNTMQQCQSTNNDRSPCLCLNTKIDW